MKMIYIAGPYRGEVEKNIKNAQAVGDRLVVEGIAFICPHSNGRPHDHLKAPDEYWISSTLEIMRRCDAVLVFGDFEKSSGTLGEIAEAERMGKPVFYQTGDCVRWVKEKQ